MLASRNQRPPGVHVTVMDDHLDGVLRRLARWELDLALIYHHDALPPTAAQLERTNLLDDPFDVIVPDHHRLAGRRSVTLGDLGEDAWISGTSAGAYARIVLHTARDVASRTPGSGAHAPESHLRSP
jgi:DNA-binding transcriptional LysR family regulator